MSNQNSPDQPVFQVSEKMYQQLLDWQQEQEKSSENLSKKSTEKDSDSNQLEVDEKIDRNDN
ncbi:MAG: hypothetical protein SWJ54_02925 [Cyanobacteriota bacterium]|nr:hypothetical protein [Cyanobacteriota bacterium]